MAVLEIPVVPAGQGPVVKVRGRAEAPGGQTVGRAAVVAGGVVVEAAEVVVMAAVAPGLTAQVHRGAARAIQIIKIPTKLNLARIAKPANLWNTDPAASR